MLAAKKTLTNSKDCSGSRMRISVTASVSFIGRFSPMFTRHWMAASGIKVQDHRAPVSVFRVRMAALKQEDYWKDI